MALSAAAEAALDGAAPLEAWFCEIACPGVTLRLVDQSIAPITFSSKTFTSSDPDYGVLVRPKEFTEAGGAESPRLDFAILCPSDEAAGDLLELLDDGPIRWWLGSINRETGLPVATPDRFWSGFLGQAKLGAGLGTSAVTIEAVTSLEHFLDRGEGYAMNDASHQALYPGELFFEDSGTDAEIYWGGKDPASKRAAVTNNQVAIGRFFGNKS